MTAMLRVCALGLGLLLTAIPASWAADQTVTLRLGSGPALLLERPYKTVIIGDPTVVDVFPLGSRSVILLPLNLGASNLIFVDEKGIAITNVSVLVRNAGTI